MLELVFMTSRPYIYKRYFTTYIYIVLPFFVLLVSISYYLHKFVSLLIKFF